MNNKKIVIFIDDEEASRDVFSDVLDDLYGDEFEIKSIEPNKELSDMMETMGGFASISSIVIDERLSVTGKTNYKGSELAEELRNIHEILPIYILTSDPSSLDPICGSVEFVLDKGQIEVDSYKEHVKKLFTRHVANTEILISEKRAKYDALLAKSISSPLSEEELTQLKSLELFRLKPLASIEPLVSEKDIEVLRENEKLLKELESLLQGGQ